MVLMPRGLKTTWAKAQAACSSSEGWCSNYLPLRSQVRINAASEAAQAKNRTEYRTKLCRNCRGGWTRSYWPRFQQLTNGQQEAMERRAFEIAGKAKDGGALLNRLLAKDNAKQGKDAREVREEVVTTLSLHCLVALPA